MESEILNGYTNQLLGVIQRNNLTEKFNWNELKINLLQVY